MKAVYLAGQYARRDELRVYGYDLLARNIFVTASWLWEELPLQHKLSEFDTEWLTRAAAKDVADIERADTMIFFAETPENQPQRGGRHVEFGLALALGKKIVVVGGRENIFHYVPGVQHFTTFEELMESLDVKG